MSTKSWNYQQISEAAEHQIRLLAKNAVGKDEATAALYRQWAYGIYMGWDGLTSGWQENGDRECMEALARDSF